MRWELEPVDTGCVLRLSHFVTDADAAIDNCYVVGLHTSLARLEPASPVGPSPGTGTASPRRRRTTPSLGLAAPVAAS